MPETTPPNTADSGHEVPTYFVRNRNALVVRASLSEFYVDYYLHLASQKIKYEPEHDALFKKALAAFVLHMAGRPWNEMFAWTLHFQKPHVNLFLTADNETGAVTGRVFDENVKDTPENLFYSDVVRAGQTARRSTVAFAGADPLAAVETFYAQSEQRLTRIFEIADEEFVMVTEHPDCDMDWLRGLTAEQAKALGQTETLALLERRIYRWHCGCNQQRMMEVLAPMMISDPEDLFAGEPKIEIRCPRCGARHAITREAMEAFVIAKEKS